MVAVAIALLCTAACRSTGPPGQELWLPRTRDRGKSIRAHTALAATPTHSSEKTDAMATNRTPKLCRAGKAGRDLLLRPRAVLAAAARDLEALTVSSGAPVDSIYHRFDLARALLREAWPASRPQFSVSLLPLVSGQQTRSEQGLMGALAITQRSRMKAQDCRSSDPAPTAGFPRREGAWTLATPCRRYQRGSFRGDRPLRSAAGRIRPEVPALRGSSEDST